VIVGTKIAKRIKSAIQNGLTPRKIVPVPTSGIRPRWTPSSDAYTLSMALTR